MAKPVLILDSSSLSFPLSESARPSYELTIIPVASRAAKTAAVPIFWENRVFMVVFLRDSNLRTPLVHSRSGYLSMLRPGALLAYSGN